MNRGPDINSRRVGWKTASSATCWLSCVLLGLAAVAGCAGLTRHRQRDAVVAARQIALRGMDALEAGQLERAERYFGEAVEACPVDERVRSRYAEALWRRGEQDQAIEHMREAVRLSGGESELRIRLGEMLLARGELGEAQHLAERVIAAGRPSAAAYRLRGDALARQGGETWRDALACYHRALALQEHYPEVQLAAAELYLRHGEPRRALATLQRLSEAYSADQVPLDVLQLQGLAYKATFRYDRAIGCFHELIARGGGTSDVLYQLADACYLAGDRRTAQRAVQQVLEVEPEHVAAQRLGSLIR